MPKQESACTRRLCLRVGTAALSARSGVLAAFQRGTDRDIGGFRVALDAQGRSSNYVTQTMLSADGRVIG